MCGISGVIGFDDPGVVKRMTDSLRHRGPDDEGAYTDNTAGLGMVRLSVIDLATGHQPMTDEQRRYWIVFNGEIYTYQTLRSELEAKGHRFTSRTDTEVIVHLYEDLQERCVEPLNGDFAFAIWDAAERRLFLARDRLGVKPLYYWHSGRRFAFASELKALLRLPEVSRALDYEAIDAYLTYLYVPAPRSVFQHIKKLPPGCWLSFQNGTVRLERYWDVPEPSSALGVREPLAEPILAALQDAVRLRLVSDVPLGAFLSGGIDSSSVVALMSRCTSRPVQTFSIGFEKPHASYNELPAARLVAERFQTDHHEFIVKADIARLLPQVVWHLDEPFADSSALLTFLLSREAKRTVTVALTGIGGDELFGGYPRYLGAWASLAYEKLPGSLRGGLASMAGILPESTTSRNLAGRLKRFADGGLLPPEDRYLAWISYLTRPLKDGLYSEGFRAALNGVDAHAPYRALLARGTAGFVDRVNALDLQTYLPDDLLVMGDKMSMAHGLEVRVPFCDHRLVEAACAIPMQRRLKGFRLKALLKEAVRSLLPPALLGKPKQGFMVPIGAWLTRELQPLCRDLLSPSAVKRRGLFRPEAVEALVRRQRTAPVTLSHHVYALLVLELWFRRYLDGPVS